MMLQYIENKNANGGGILKALADCFPCVLMQARRSLDEWQASDKEKFAAMEEATKSLGNATFGMKPTELSKLANEAVKRVSGVRDLYAQRKRALNESAQAIIKDVIDVADSSPNPLKSLATAAILGNHLDLGVNEVELDKEFLEILKGKTLKVDDFELFVSKMKKATHVLYILDNTGEVIFDKAFSDRIKALFDVSMKFAVRSEPIINDVTREEALEVGFSPEEIIDSGSAMAGMDLNVASDEFMKAWKEADVIVSKGQGNFEGLDEVHDERLFFFLEAKCPLIAGVLHVSVGDAILANWK
jgi:uncharacterized protein with ATP-grasp and redox domains